MGGYKTDQWNHKIQDNDIKTYSTHNEGKSVVAARFIRVLKNKICINMASALLSSTCVIEDLKEGGGGGRWKLLEGFMKRNSKNQVKNSLQLKK